MGRTDRFGGSDAWELHCLEFDAQLAMTKRANPGCGTCQTIIKCPDCGAIYCTKIEDWVDEFNPYCGYESYEG